MQHLQELRSLGVLAGLDLGETREDRSAPDAFEVVDDLSLRLQTET